MTDRSLFSSMLRLVGLLALLIVAAHGQEFRDNLVIDDFSIDTPIIVILTPTASYPFPLSSAMYTQGDESHIIGSERDLELTILDSPPNYVSSSGVSNGAFTCSTPNDSYSESLLQWDGIDGSMNVNETGLNSNFLSGNANSIRFLAQSDRTTSLKLRVYSSGNLCSTDIAILETTQVEDYIVPFSDFSGKCNFGNVTAFEMLVDMASSTDVLIERITTYGEIPSEPNCPPCICICMAESEILVIDNFSYSTSPLVIVIDSSNLPVSDTQFDSADYTQIIGGERDVELSAYAGVSNSVLISSISNKSILCSSSSGSYGETLLQWDGYDGSMNVNENGLNSNFLSGHANSIRFGAKVDLPTSLKLLVYSNGNSCSTSVTLIPGNNQIEDYIVPFSNFSGNCDFGNVGAFEMLVDMTSNTDVIIEKITTHRDITNRPGPSDPNCPPCICICVHDDM